LQLLTHRFALILSDDNFDEFEKWSRKKIEEYQLDRLRRLVAEVKKTNSLYNVKLKELDPDDISSIEALSEVPPTSKKDLISALSSEDLTSNEDQRIFFTTRGSTGETLVIPQNDEELDEYGWPAARGLWWSGLRRGMKIVTLPPAWHRLAASEAAAVGLIGAEQVIFWGSTSEKYVQNFLKAVRRTRAQFISITTPFLLTIFNRGGKRALEGVEKCITVGAPLSIPARKKICEESGLGEIFERAGTQEGAAMDECRFHDAHHIHEDVCLLEVVKMNDVSHAAAGEVGRLVVTAFVRRSVPTIRYLTGDLAVFFDEECRCGRKLKRVELLDREENIIVVDGKRILPYQVRQIMDRDEEYCARNFVMVRGKPDKLHVIVEGGGDLNRLRRLLKDELYVEVLVESTGSIPLRFGFRPVINFEDLNKVGF